MDAMRMIGLLLASRAGPGGNLGRYQSATNSNARSDVPTQAMYRAIGITISRCANVARANAVSPDSSLWNVVTARIPVEQARSMIPIPRLARTRWLAMTLSS